MTRRAPVPSVLPPFPILLLVLVSGLVLSPRPAAVAGEPLPPPARPGPPPDPVASLGTWLGHEDPVLRALAAFELRRHADERVIGLVTRRLPHEQDPVVLAFLLGSLEGRARPDLIREGGAFLPGLLLRLLEDERPLIRERARAALGPIPATPIPGDAEAWRRWWVGHRKALEDEQARMRESVAPPQPGTLAPGAASVVPGESRTTPADRPEDLYDHVEGLRRDGLEVCIVLDHTGSMAPVIGAASARAAWLVRRLAWLVPRFRAGLVTYDDQARLRIELTGDGEALQRVFRKVAAGGGGDWEEGVDKGIALALEQDRLGWSRRAHRVLVVIGDAPPHLGDVEGLLRRIRSARDDDLFDHPVTVHTVSTHTGGVDHFPQIARAGGGVHVTLATIAHLQEELVALSFGAAWRDRVDPWLREIERIRKALDDR